MNDLASAMEEAFTEADQLMAREGLPTTGEPASVYHKFNMKTRVFDFTSGYTVPEPVSVPSTLSSWSVPAVNSLHVQHLGNYEHLGNAWSAAHQVFRYKKLKPNKAGGYEIYRNNPETTPAAEIKTDIYLPLAR